MTIEEEPNKPTGPEAEFEAEAETGAEAETRLRRAQTNKQTSNF